MLRTMWSVKGGAGVTVCAVALASALADDGSSVLIVDLCGDVPAALGLADPSGPGVHDWLASADGSADALGRLRVEVQAGLSMLPCGRADSWDPERADELAVALGAAADHVVVDAGPSFVSRSPDRHDRLVHTLAEQGRSFLVTRPCYLSLRRAVAAHAAADGVVLVRDPGRCLDRRDVADVLGLDVVATVDVDPVVARTVDAGLLCRRGNRPLMRSLRALR